MAENPYAATSTPLDKSAESVGDSILASRFKRFVARLVDDLLTVVVVVVSLLVFLGPSETMNILLGSDAEELVFDPMIFLLDLSGSTFIILIFGIVITFVLQGYLLHQYGQTIGKRLLGIKIVENESGQKPTLMRTFVIRECGMSVLGLSMLLNLINVLWIFGPPRKCLHDYWSSTKVVNAK